MTYDNRSPQIRQEVTRSLTMAMAPRFKVYSADEYVASFKYPDHAAVLVSAIGGTIRLGHNRVVWDEGNEIQSANESYDFVAETVYGRISE